MQTSHLISFIYQCTMTPNFSSCSILECDQPSVRVAGGCDSCTRHVYLTYKCAEVGETNLLCFPSHKPFLDPPTSQGSRGAGQTPLGESIADDTTHVSRIVTENRRLRSQTKKTRVCELPSRVNGGGGCSIKHSSNVGPGGLMPSAD